MLKNYLHKKTSPAPLAVFRILFGFMMLCSILRFLYKDWIYTQYIEPTYYFTYYGFDWVQPFGEWGMHFLFVVMAIASFCIMLGWFYRLNILIFFFTFTYVELIDKTNYLNHYYFVSIVSFLLMCLPAHCHFSIDAWRNPSIRLTAVPCWMIDALKLQLGMVYFFAGIAKLNPDWLFRAMPLAIWLPPKADLPVVGWLFNYRWVHYVFSWAGAAYDLCIPFLLCMPQTRLLAYLAVIVFHVMTAILFPIGMFPYIMILSTLIFFSEDFHKKLLARLQKIGAYWLPKTNGIEQQVLGNQFFNWKTKFILTLFCCHFVLQIFLPFRYLLYPNHLFWAEEGYRFSWRVMLIEKEGETVFMVHDPVKNQNWEVYNLDYLNRNQEKMMNAQPDMILQFAHHLEKVYQAKGIADPAVYVDARVSLNGRRSRPFIDSTVDLTKIEEGFQHKSWVLPYSY